MNGLITDIRLAFRAIRRHPIVTLLATISLALAIGGNAMTFSLVNVLLIRPLPYPDPDRLVVLWQSEKENAGFDLIPTSPANFVDWQERSTSFEEMGALQETPLSLTGGDQPEPVFGAAASVNMFRILGAQTALGRTFLPEEEERGLHRVVVLGHDLWRNRFAADPALVGQTIDLRGEPYRVVGVMPEDFELLDPRFQLWVPLTLPTDRLPRDERSLLVVARLKPDVLLADAQKEMITLAANLESEYPDANRGYSAKVLTLQQQMTYGGGREILVLLQEALVFVLLIAAANLANLLLARGQDRQREIALRAALGASRHRIIRQLLVESVVLALGGGLIGLLLGAWGIDFLVKAFGGLWPKMIIPQLDGSVVGFTMAISVLAGVAFGLAPALRASRPSLVGDLREGGRGTGIGSRRRVMSRALVVAEVALALVMLSGAGVFVTSIREWHRADAGIDVDQLLTFQLGLPQSDYEDDGALATLSQQVIEELEALPGVTSATLANHLPRSPFPPRVSFSVDGRPLPEEERLPNAAALTVSPGYLRTLKVPLLQGRSFLRSDGHAAAPVVLINEAMQRAHFPDESPLGQRITVQDESREIVGVLSNVKEDMFRDSQAGAEPILYLPQAQSPSRQVAVVVRTTPEPMSLSGPVRSALWELDRNLSVAQIRTMKDFIAQFFVSMRVFSSILTGFGILAVVLAAVGIYGVIAFSVSKRTHEIGVRMALGARKTDVTRLVIKEGLLLAALGFGIGLPGVLIVLRIVSSAVSALTPTAPGASLAVGLTLLVVALATSYVPARRAASLDPVVALRHE